MSPYNQGFFANRHAETAYSAETILDIVLARLPGITSAIDAGCGVGTWLSILQHRGIEDVIGIDGSYVDRSLLRIPQDCFVTASLDEQWPVTRR